MANNFNSEFSFSVDEICAKLRAACRKAALLTASQKNAALKSVIEALKKNKDTILSANAQDVREARAKGMSESLVERLALDQKKFDSITDGIAVIISQSDPVGEESAGWKTPDGMQIRQVRVPLGVVAIIYESRPNVTADAFALAYKSGNAILLRGSSSAFNSNKAIVSAIKEGLASCKDGGIEDSLYLCSPKADHSDVNEILGATGKIDVVLPRGGANLIRSVVQNAKIPVIETGSGVCHLFVEDSADAGMAAKIAGNAKMQRPGACNAIETILVQRGAAPSFLPLMAKEFAEKVLIKADKDSYSILQSSYKNLTLANEEDFGFEFLDFTVAVKIVDSTQEAIEFINAHNTKHSECIVTNNRVLAREFQAKVDAACVYVNASTRFTDGGEFGFGAELGISTQKLHARGPMGIKALTTTKFLIDGDGQVR